MPSRVQRQGPQAWRPKDVFVVRQPRVLLQVSQERRFARA